MDSVGVERRVSPPPRRWGACHFLESFEWETTVYMCASPRGAPAAIVAISPPRIDARACLKGVCLGRFCRRRNFVRQCSRVIVADSPLKTELKGVLKRLTRGKAVLIYANWSIDPPPYNNQSPVYGRLI